jgi:hypothetical protein
MRIGGMPERFNLLELILTQFVNLILERHGTFLQAEVVI